MSKSVARQHLKLLLQRTALADSQAKSSEALPTGPTKRKFDEQPKKAKTIDGKSIVNPFIQAVDDREGNHIEISRQVKKAKRIVRKESEKALEQTNNDKKKTLDRNLKVLLRPTGKKGNLSNKVEDALKNIQPKKK